MRKVLLATTALVAMSVTAAQADVSIGGQAVFEIYSPDQTAQTYSTDGGINIKGTSTTDSGLTFTALSQLKFEGGAVNDSYIDIAGDFGSIRMGATDNALDRMDKNVAAHIDLEGTTGSAATDAKYGTQIAGGDDQNISFIAPSMGGATVYAVIKPEGAYNGMGINYSMAGFNMHYQAVSGSLDKSAFGVSFTAAGATVAMGSATTDATSTAARIKANDIGISYGMGDITVVATSASGKQGTRTDKYKNFGVSYAVAPGVTAMVETGQATINAVDTDATWMGLAVDF
ncbi:porin [Alphaproteobacteria bacterium]|nr:porin [Alphaproteobacteria bacterium]